LLAVVAVSYLFLRTQPEQRLLVAGAGSVHAGSSPITGPVEGPAIPPREGTNADKLATEQAGVKKTREPGNPRRIPDDPGVLFTDAAYTDGDTASHLDQAQKLLVSFRSLPADDDDDVDVSYEKTESRRLLNENVVLRRDAEATGKFPTKSVLGSLEPFLIDIANLPDKAPASDIRQIKDRVQRTEIVAELRSY
jgi:hypothetical protein